MSKALTIKQNADKLERLLIFGDLAGLDEKARISYVGEICRLTGISIYLRPFDYIKFQGKTILYANKSATDQLRKLNNISIEIVSRERIDGLYVVTANASMKGRVDSAIGAIAIKGLNGTELANALMKCETKAKRRATLSLCGLGVLDEIEAKELLERDTKEAAEVQTQIVQAKTETESRPTFEVEMPIEPDPEQHYVFKSGRSKGKRLGSYSAQKLRGWLNVYHKSISEGAELANIVHQDAKEVAVYLDRIDLAKWEQQKLDIRDPEA